MEKILEDFVAAELAAGRRKTDIMRLLCDITSAAPSTVWPWLAGTKPMGGAACLLLEIWMAAAADERVKFFPAAEKNQKKAGAKKQQH